MPRTLSRPELVELAERILELKLAGEELDKAVALFKENVKDEAVLDLVFWSDEQITAEELVARGLEEER